MDPQTIDELLVRSAPAARGAEPSVSSELVSLVHGTRIAARRTRRRRWWALAPVALVPALAFTATAGQDPRMIPDLVIPIEYTTDTGVTVSCSLEFFNGEIDYVETSFAGVDYLSAQDWTGIGQRIYERALEYEASGGEDAARWAWPAAANDLVFPPEGAWQAGDHFGGDSDCTGQLH